MAIGFPGPQFSATQHQDESWTSPYTVQAGPMGRSALCFRGGNRQLPASGILLPTWSELSLVLTPTRGLYMDLWLREGRPASPD